MNMMLRDVVPKSQGVRCLGSACTIADVSIFQGCNPYIFVVKSLSGRNIYPKEDVSGVWSLKFWGGVPRRKARI